MILLWGVPGDSPLDAVRAALDQTGADYQLLDQRHAAQTRISLNVADDGVLSGEIVNGTAKIDLDRIGSAYIRPFESAKAAGVDAPDDPALLAAVEADTRMITWADLTPAGVVNRPAMMAANNSKPHQLALIASFGFAVPNTLVTTDEISARRFREQHGEVIYKSISGVRSIVSRLTDPRCGALADVANCPTQFQQYIPGTDVRVHVAGDAVFAAEITSPADDYRYASRSGASMGMAPATLPLEFEDRCRAMARGMGLRLAGIDFRRTPAGEWYCLEVNPSPGFTFFEAGTGQPIAAAVANLLIALDAPTLDSAQSVGLQRPIDEVVSHNP
jgi:glutathione synthase/RimK-type ligase-like ATP-grasp enzyme